MLKIVYGGNEFYHWNPNYGFAFEHINIYDSLRRMKDIKVIYFKYDQVKEFGPKKLNQALIDLIHREKPDMFLSIMYYEDLTPETMMEINKICPTVGFFMDDHWHFYNSSKKIAPYLTWIVTTYSPAVGWYKRLGCKNVIRTHLGANYHRFSPGDKPTLRIFDVSFVGAWYINRERVINKLQKAGIKVDAWGPGWPKGRLQDQFMETMVLASKINVDINPPSSYFGVKPLIRLFLKKENGRVKSDVNNFFNNVREWWGKRTPMIKPRTFNCLAARSFVITQMTHDLLEFYEIDKEIVAYKSIPELIEKIKYYLAHDEEREKIAEAGYRRTLRDHTYEKRFEEIFKKI